MKPGREASYSPGPDPARRVEARDLAEAVVRRIFPPGNDGQRQSVLRVGYGIGIVGSAAVLAFGVEKPHGLRNIRHIIIIGIRPAPKR